VSHRARLATAFGVDLRSLAAFRVALGALLLYDLATRALDLRAHYTEAGVLPADLAPPPVFGSDALSPFRLASDPLAVGALFGLAGVAAVGLAVGWRPRLMALAGWLLLTGIQARNPLVVYEADVLLKLLLFWGFLLPLGSRAALDGRSPPRGPPPTRYLSAASAGLVLQVCCVYWFAALEKDGAAWWDGTAVTYALGLEAYATDLGRWLRVRPALCAALTWGSLAVEALAPLLVVAPVRTPAARLAGVGLLAGLQVGFFVAMDLGIFPAASLVALVPLVPGAVWDRARPDRTLVDRSRLRNGVAGALAAAVVVWNASVLRRSWNDSALPAPLARPIRLLGLDQHWPMFAPEPLERSVWFVVGGERADGREVDLLRGGPLGPGRPDDVSASYGGDRWKELLMVIEEDPDLWDLWPRVGAVLNARYARAHPEGPLVRVWAFVCAEETRPDGTKGPVERRLLWVGSRRPGADLPQPSGGR